MAAKDETEATFEVKSGKIDADTLAKKANIPVEEVALPADKNGNTGIWVREVLPPFSIHTKDGLIIDVPPIPMTELNEADRKHKIREERAIRDQESLTNRKGVGIPRDELFNCFEKRIRNAKNCPKDLDLKFVRVSLMRFYDEYKELRNNHLDMSALVRSAMKHGISFHFYEVNAPKDGVAKQLENNVAQYAPSRQTIEFNCKQYVYGNVNATYHNTFAHELCHFAMHDKKDGYLCTFLESDFGKMWYEGMKTEAFCGNKKWQKAWDEYKKKGKRGRHGSGLFMQHLSDEYTAIIKSSSYKSQNAKAGEMFARLMGMFASQPLGLDLVPKETSCRMGCDLVCLLATADANNDTATYNAVLEALKTHQVSSELKDKIIEEKSLKEDIVEKGTYSLDENFAIVGAILRYDEALKSECEAIKKEIGKKVKAKEKSNAAILDGKKMSGLYQSLADASLVQEGIVKTIETKDKDGNVQFVEERTKLNRNKLHKKKEGLFPVYTPLKNPPAVRLSERTTNLIKKVLGRKEK